MICHRCGLPIRDGESPRRLRDGSGWILHNAAIDCINGLRSRLARADAVVEAAVELRKDIGQWDTDDYCASCGIERTEHKYKRHSIVTERCGFNKFDAALAEYAGKEE